MTFRSENCEYFNNDKLLDRIDHVEEQIKRCKIFLADAETHPVYSKDHIEDWRISLIRFEEDQMILYAELEARMKKGNI